MERDSHTDEEIKQVFSLKKIAVIGMSKHSAKAAHFVPKYLSEQGFDITPINPNAIEILGKKSYPDVSSLDHPVDVVDVFRPSGGSVSLGCNTYATCCWSVTRPISLTPKSTCKISPDSTNGFFVSSMPPLTPLR